MCVRQVGRCRGLDGGSGYRLWVFTVLLLQDFCWFSFLFSLKVRGKEEKRQSMLADKKAFWGARVSCNKFRKHPPGFSCHRLRWPHRPHC